LRSSFSSAVVITSLISSEIPVDQLSVGGKGYESNFLYFVNIAIAKIPGISQVYIEMRQLLESLQNH